MKKCFIIFLLPLFLMIQCEKINIPNGYPTTYRILSNSAINEKRTSYTGSNQYIKTSLNHFGFCDMDGDFLSRPTPPYNGDITESQAISAVYDFVSKNASETGVNNPQLLDFHSKSKELSFDGSVLWHLKSVNQKVDTIEVKYTEIQFHLENGKVSLCYGNWYPQIFIPDRFNLSEAKAMSTLIGKEVLHSSISGQEYKSVISKKNLENSSVNLMILPKNYDDRIELHVCWQINVHDVFYILYVDVMTGDIVGQEPTMIS